MMPIRWLSVRGYRSIQRLRLELSQVNVIVGPNGCGKSNLYRALYLLNRAAAGRFASTLAIEGGMPSCLWAGERRQGESKRIAVDVGFAQWQYRLAFGLPGMSRSAFALDPYIREEQLSFLNGGVEHVVFSRRNALAQLRDESGRRVETPFELTEWESILADLREPHRFPEVSALRETFLGWRFYHQFRTDTESPLRRPQVAVRTPVLSHDGADLAAALQTIIEIGDYNGLQAAIGDAFDGAALDIGGTSTGMEVRLRRSEFRRSFAATELSDGTLKYFCLLAALFSPRPPALLALNEPDANLHPDLIAPLARLIALARRDSQLWITTHSRALAEALERMAGAKLIPLVMRDGATTILGDMQTEWESSDEEVE